MLTIWPIQEVPDMLEPARALYRRAFPPRERIPFSMMTGDTSGTSEVFVFLREGTFAAFCCLLNNRDLSHITYLAVEEKERDKGYGSEILRLIREQKPGQRILVDIEEPEEGTPNARQRLRRKAFYLRAGYQESAIRYNWRGEDYKILSCGGAVSEAEFWQFWREIR